MVEEKASQWIPPLTVAGVLFMVVASALMIPLVAGSPTLVSLSPASLSVSAGSSFTMSVNCSPAKPVKGFELRVSFNPSILQASSVSEGDFFGGYTTFSNPGTINNQAGTIINVYDLIVGQGNVTANGSLVTLSFTAGSYSGSSAVTLSGVRLTNETEYIPVSVSSASVAVTGGMSPPPGPPPSKPPVTPPGENLPPGAPAKPVGPTIIELGTSFVYSSSAIDPEGSLVRLRFDWGDGSLSPWSDLVGSNTSVPFSHAWGTVSSFSVRAIAQDEAGLNSSWSEPLTVVVSQAESGNQSPVASFVLPLGVMVNQTVMFDASSSIDPDGVIVLYAWDFGDGTQGSGEIVTHLYSAPGQYLVSLTVTDAAGLISTVGQYVDVAAQASNSPVVGVSFGSYLPVVALAGVLGALLVFVVLFREQIRGIFVRARSVPVGSSVSFSGSEVTEIEQLLDALFQDIQNQVTPVSKEHLLEAYCDLIIENVEVGTNVRLPELSIEQVERIVDERFHARISEKLDKIAP